MGKFIRFLWIIQMKKNIEIITGLLRILLLFNDEMLMMVLIWVPCFGH
jgi:hypothetical protein